MFAGTPLWVTQVDSTSRFGRVEPNSIVVTADASGDTRVIVGGQYITERGRQIRFWHVDANTSEPVRLPRAQALRRGGACDEAYCSGAGSAADPRRCRKRLLLSDPLDCLGAGRLTAGCLLRRCAYLEGYESLVTGQASVWLGALDARGAWLWHAERFGPDVEGLELAGGMPGKALALAPARARLPGLAARAEGGVLVAFTLESAGAPGGAPARTLTLGPAARHENDRHSDDEDRPQVASPAPRAPCPAPRAPRPVPRALRRARRGLAAIAPATSGSSIAV